MAAVAYKSCGTGEPIVFLHGVGGGAESWDAQLASFGTTHRALAWDMPGYGASPAVPAPGFRVWAEALADWLDQLAIPRCVLVGHSIGGMIAQTFMKAHPHRVSRLVLSATSPAFGNPDGDFQREFIRARVGPLDAGATMAELAARFVPELVGSAAPTSAHRSAIAVMSRVPASSYRAAMHALMHFDEREALPNIAVPCLLLAGEDDKSAPPRVMQRMGEKIGGARVVTVAGMGHLGNLEMPDRYNRTLSDFLDETSYPMQAGEAPS